LFLHHLRGNAPRYASWPQAFPSKPKWSDSQPGSSRACTVLSSSDQKRRMPRFSAPRLPFSPTAGLTLQSAPQLFTWSGPVARSGLSLVHNSCSLQSLHCGVNVPGLLLRSVSQLASLLVRLFSSTTAAGLPRLRWLQCFQPVAVSPASPACCASGLHSPLGCLRPFGSKRSAGFAACQSAFRTRPISARSPQPIFYF